MKIGQAMMGLEKSVPQRLVLLIDEHGFTRECLSTMMCRLAKDISVRQVCSLEDLPSMVGEEFDLILMTVINRTGIRGGILFENIVRVKEAFPHVPFALLSATKDMEASFEAVRHGVQGCLSPLLGMEGLISALRLIMAGGIFISPPLPSDSPALALEGRGSVVQGASPLTAREEEVLAKVREGKPNKIIAYELCMSENTVKVHVSRILKKMNVSNRTAVACLHIPKGGAMSDVRVAG